MEIILATIEIIMLNLKKTNDGDLTKYIFNQLHAVPEIDQFWDVGKEYFRKKYNIDYFSIHAIHHSRSCFVGFYNNDAWHEFLYKNDRGLNDKNGVVVQNNKIMKSNEFYMAYFDSYHTLRQSCERADIVGARKYGGCTLMISDKENNMTVYSLTFADDAAFGTLDQKVLFALRDDLIRYQSLLLPFVNHADKFGDFSDKHILHKSMNEFMDLNPSLFNF